MRSARFWKTKASISMPAPAIAQAISDPRMPVATPKRAGSEKTPAPTMPPITMAVRVGSVILLDGARLGALGGAGHAISSFDLDGHPSSVGQGSARRVT